MKQLVIIILIFVWRFYLLPIPDLLCRYWFYEMLDNKTDTGNYPNNKNYSYS